LANADTLPTLALITITHRLQTHRRISWRAVARPPRRANRWRRHDSARRGLAAKYSLFCCGRTQRTRQIQQADRTLRLRTDRVTSGDV